MSNALDMTPMYVFHAALRRELEYLAKITSAATGGDPRHVLATAVGWELFKKALHAHHTAEDEALWPPLRKVVRPDDLALLAAMEEEHAAIDPIIEVIDTTLADHESAPDRLGELTDSLTTTLTAHLKHEEDETLPLIQATLDLQQWRLFGETSGRIVGPDASRIIPWMLDGADDTTVAAMLAPLPDPVRETYRTEWVPAYKALNLWNTHA